MILGNFIITGLIKKVSKLDDTIQVTVDIGAKQVLLPVQSLDELDSISSKLKS